MAHVKTNMDQYRPTYNIMYFTCRPNTHIIYGTRQNKHGSVYIILYVYRSMFVLTCAICYVRLGPDNIIYVYRSVFVLTCVIIILGYMYVRIWATLKSELWNFFGGTLPFICEYYS